MDFWFGICIYSKLLRDRLLTMTADAMITARKDQGKNPVTSHNSRDNWLITKALTMIIIDQDNWALPRRDHALTIIIIDNAFKEVRRAYLWQIGWSVTINERQTGVTHHVTHP